MTNYTSINELELRIQELEKALYETNQAKNTIQESEKRFQIAMEATNDGLYDWNLVTNEIYYSSGWKSILGYSNNEIPNDFSVWEKLTPAEDVQQSWKMQQELINKKRDRFELEFQMRHKDGHWVDILSRASAIFDENGEAIRIVGTHVDISERKKSVKKIAEAFAKISRAEKIAKMGSWSWNPKTNKIDWSDNMCRLYGIMPPECDSTFDYVSQFTHPDDLEYVKKYFDSLIVEKKAQNPSEYRIITPNNTTVWLENTAEVLVDDKGEIIEIVGISQDITERKQMETQIQQTQKLEAIGTLAGGIAHDFNNMLGVITGNTSYALSFLEKEHELFDVLSAIQSTSKQAQSLTQQLLTFASGGAPIKKTSDINRLISESAIFSNRGSKVNIDFELSDELWLAEVDEGQLNQVVSNVVINANQSMPYGGTITIRTENAEVIQNFPISAGRYIKIEVQDQGTGISDKHLQNIFEPYYSTKQTGSGLGLATSYSIVKKHGGHISVFSEIDKGTSFNIYLPASSKDLHQTIETGKHQHTGHGKILILDDQEEILMMAGRMVNLMGYEAEYAVDGIRAIELYRESLESQNPFNLVILDLTIPGGTGGIKTVIELLKIDPNVKAVVSSGYSNDPIMANYLDYGFCGVMAKPYSLDQMAELLNTMFGKLN